MKWLMISVAALLFAGCVTPLLTGTPSASVGEIKTVGMGDVIFGYAIAKYAGGSAAERWEISYTGMTGNTVKVQYKEYVKTYNGWIIKDAFNQLLEYDLTKSKLIAFRGFSAEVLEANGPLLKFKVLSVTEIK